VFDAIRDIPMIFASNQSHKPEPFDSRKEQYQLKKTIGSFHCSLSILDLTLGFFLIADQSKFHCSFTKFLDHSGLD
jgi:hypothetical protein